MPDATLVDTNVLLDVVTDDPAWAAWSIQQLDAAALFLAAKVFQRYRAVGGERTGVPPDFFIGAHAAVAGLPLLTRDVRRFRTCYPSVMLISPSHLSHRLPPGAKP